MADNKKTVVFEGRDQGLGSTMDQIRRRSEEMARGMIRDARDFTTSGKEALRYLEDELKLLERRNVAFRDSERIQMQSRKDAELGRKGADKGAISEKFGRKSTALDKSFEEDKMQVQLLRELIEVIKGTSRQELVSDRKGVEKMLKRSRSIGKLGLADDADEFTSLKETLQQMIVGDTGDAEARQKGMFAAATRGGGRAFNAAAGLGVQPNELYMAAGIAGMIPIFGQGLSMLASKALQEAEKLAIAKTSVAGITGFLPAAPGAAFGRTSAEILAQQGVDVTRATGGRGGMNVALQMLAMERGGNLDRGILSEFLKASSRGAGFDDLNTPMREATDLFAMSGLLGKNGQNLALLPELLQQQNSLMNDQIRVTGRAQVGRTAAFLGDLSNVFTNPSEMLGVSGMITGGTTNPANQWAQALQFRTIGNMLRSGGEASSFFDIMMAQEDPSQSPRILRGTLEEIMKSTGGNRQMAAFNLQSRFKAQGMSLSQASRLIGYFAEKGAVDPSFLTTGTGILTGGGELQPVDFTKRADSFVGLMETSTAKISDIFAEKGESIIESFDAVSKAANMLEDDLRTLRLETKKELEAKGIKPRAHHHGAIR